MLLEWESNSRKLQIISGKLQNNSITTSSTFHLAMWLIYELVSPKETNCAKLRINGADQNNIKDV